MGAGREWGSQTPTPPSTGLKKAEKRWEYATYLYENIFYFQVSFTALSVARLYGVKQ
jgi:hypothetical protein